MSEQKILSKLKKAGTIAKDAELFKSTNNDSENKTPSDFLTLLKNELSRPFLSLLKDYLRAANGNKRTDENCISEFRQNHKKFFKCFFVADSFVAMFYIVVVIIVALRGLGIIQITPISINLSSTAVEAKVK